MPSTRTIITGITLGLVAVFIANRVPFVKSIVG